MEDPTIALRQLKPYMELDGYDPDAELRLLGEERDAAEAELRESLSADGWARLAGIMNVARDVAPILEDHNFYIDQLLTTLPRRLILESGRRLVAKSIIEEAADVFFLHLGELTDVLRDPGTAGIQTLHHYHETGSKVLAPKSDMTVESPQHLGYGLAWELGTEDRNPMEWARHDVRGELPVNDLNLIYAKAEGQRACDNRPGGGSADQVKIIAQTKLGVTPDSLPEYLLYALEETERQGSAYPSGVDR